MLIDMDFQNCCTIIKLGSPGLLSTYKCMLGYVTQKFKQRREENLSIYRQLCNTVAKVPLGEYKVTHRSR